tara:strand:+ start:1462 stop:2469 length:1008 start_codon:yes stop_codon:yes gene_type:complete
VKLSRKELNIIIENYLNEADPRIARADRSHMSLSTQQLDEGLFEGSKLGVFIARITNNVMTISARGDWKNAIKEIVRKAGSAKKAMDNAYKILASNLVNNVVGLAKKPYQNRLKEIAKSVGMTFEKYSKTYPAIDIPYIKQLIDYCDSQYPGILTDSLKRKFKGPLTRLMSRLNPHIDSNAYFDAMFNNIPLPSVVQPETEKIPSIAQATPKNPVQASVEFFQTAIENDDELMQDFLDEYYGYEGESVDITNLTDAEIDDIADAFYDMYGYDPRVSYNDEVSPPPTPTIEPPLEDTDIDMEDNLDPSPAVKTRTTPAKKRRKQRIRNILKRLKRR